MRGFLKGLAADRKIGDPRDSAGTEGALLLTACVTPIVFDVQSVVSVAKWPRYQRPNASRTPTQCSIQGSVVGVAAPALRRPDPIASRPCPRSRYQSAVWPSGTRLRCYEVSESQVGG